MTVKELVKYDMPTYYEFVPFNWMQEILAKRLAKRVCRKIKRYDARVAMIVRLKGNVSNEKDQK